ncbi:MAG: Spy/CpxP family protein refolding chaperone [Pseudomonadota bacterium]
MKTSNLRKTLIAAAIAAATGLGGAAVLAQAPQGQTGQPGQGMGPGMMGPGMMGPGMMGPGMMGGGMMGPGMMGGGMMGPGMMGGGMGYGMLSQLNLSPDQWNKVEEIQEETRKRNWDLMGKMQDESYKLRRLLSAPQRDRKAIAEQYRKLSELRQQGFEARLEAHDKLEGVLTKEQREQLRQFAPWWGQDQ